MKIVGLDLELYRKMCFFCMGATCSRGGRGKTKKRSRIITFLGLLWKFQISKWYGSWVMEGTKKWETITKLDIHQAIGILTFLYILTEGFDLVKLCINLPIMTSVQSMGFSAISLIIKTRQISQVIDRLQGIIATRKEFENWFCYY